MISCQRSSTSWTFVKKRWPPRQAYAAYVQHPWALQAFGRGTRVGPNMLRHAEQSAAAVASLDLAPADAWIALSIVHEWTIGHALHVVTLREDAELEGQLSGADAVLDGIERRFVSR